MAGRVRVVREGRERARASERERASESERAAAHDTGELGVTGRELDELVTARKGLLRDRISARGLAGVDELGLDQQGRDCSGGRLAVTHKIFNIRRSTAWAARRRVLELDVAWGGGETCVAATGTGDGASVC